MNFFSRLSVLQFLCLMALPQASVFAEPALALRPSILEASEVQAWRSYMDATRDAGVAFLEAHPQGDAADRAEALLYLVSQLSISVQMTMAARDRDLPLLRLGATNIGKWGLDGADARYLGAAIDPAGRYMLRGTLGSARISAVQVVSDFPRFVAHASLPDEDLKSAGSEVEVLLSAQRPLDWQGLWLPLEQDANRLVIREYFGDWQLEEPASWRLERLDVAAPPTRLPDPASTLPILEEIVARLRNRLEIWMPWVERTRDSLANQLVQLSPGGQGLQSNIYGEGWFSLAEDEVLLVEMEAPQAMLWSIQLGNMWWESLDYIHRPGSLNSEQSLPDPDGRYRIIIAAADPGYANWLDTGGRGEGAIMYRFQNSRNSPLPVATLHKISALPAVMPKDAVMATPAMREAQRELRRAHAHRRWSP